MPWQHPTLEETRALSRDFLHARLPGADAAVPNSVLRVVSDSNAGLAHLNLLFLDWLAAQFLPDTAETEWLDRHAAIWIGGRHAATYAEGRVTVTGTNGTIVPAGTRFDGATGIEYESTAQIVVGSGPTNVPIRALTAGAAGNQVSGASISIVSVVDGVEGPATVVALTGGVNTESDESLRKRVLFRIQRPPMGGDADDYVAWARDVPGVSRAWCAPNEMGIGTVTVRFMMDELRASSDGFPNPTDVAAVRLHIDGRRPVAVKDFFVEAPIPYPINFGITGLQSDDAATRAAIQASVRAMLRLRAKPGHAINGVLQPAQTIYRSWVGEAVSQAIGEEYHELAFTTTPMPSNGHMAVLGTVTFG